MSVPNENYKDSYIGRGDTGPYAITFDVVLDDGGDATDIVVKLLDVNDVETDITATSTITGLNVYTATSYDATYHVVLIRYPALTQPYTFPYGTQFPSRTFEKGLDRLAYGLQRLALEADQSLKGPISEDPIGRLPSVADRANLLLGFDADGDPIPAVGGAAPVTPFMATVLDDADALKAKNTLGAASSVGYQAISISNFDNGNEPKIQAGSKVEVDGALYEFTSEEAGTGWSGIGNGNDVYFLLTASGSSVAWSFTTTAPTWSTSKQGWYNGLDRCFGGCRKNASSEYANKYLLDGQRTTVRSAAFGVHNSELVTADTTLAVRKSYMVMERATLTLPSDAEVGDTIEVVVGAWSRIVQGHADQVISWRNALYTTKGTSGFLMLATGDRVRLIYRGSGFNPQAPTKISDPGTLPASTGWGAAFSPNARYLAIAHATTPFITIYDFATGAPVKIANPGTLPASDANNVAWSPDGRYLAVAHNTTPFVTIYDWATGSPVKIADPGTLPTGNGQGVGWSPDGLYLCVGHTITPFITIYDWTSGAPVKMTNPTVLPTNVVNAIAWSADGRFMACACDTTPFLLLYEWTTGIAVKYTDPVSLPPAVTSGVHWSPDGRYCTTQSDSTPWISTYDFTTNLAVKLPNPATLPGSTIGRFAAWSHDGRYVAVGNTTSRFLTIYKRTGASMVKIADPGTLPTGTARGGAWSSDGRWFAVAHAITPFVTIYDLRAVASKEWIVEIETHKGKAASYQSEIEYRFV